MGNFIYDIFLKHKDPEGYFDPDRKKTPHAEFNNANANNDNFSKNKITTSLYYLIHIIYI